MESLSLTSRGIDYLPQGRQQLLAWRHSVVALSFKAQQVADTALNCLGRSHGHPEP